MKLRPYDLSIWFGQIDINVLSASDADELAHFEVASDAGLERMVREWIAPRFEANNDVTKRSMKDVLSASDYWTDGEIDHVFGQFSYPAEGELDVHRLLSALRRFFLS